MRILAYSYFVPYKDHIPGGAQMFFNQLLMELAHMGVHIDIVCPHHDGSHQLIEHPSIDVHTVLNENKLQPTEIYKVFANLQVLSELVQKADLVFSIDRTFPLQTAKPVVLALNTLAYSSAAQVLLSGLWDALVVPSRYAYTLISPFIKETHWQNNNQPPIAIIENGINTDIFKPSDSSYLIDKLSLPTGAKLLLFPHRPEKAKGFPMALDLMEQIKALALNFKLLIPVRPKSNISSRAYEASYTATLTKQVYLRGLEDFVVFHDWINLDDLAAYFSLGHTTLNFSLLPETFGFVPIQSISCGTPVITTRAGAIAEILPEAHGVEFVGFDEMSHIIDKLSAPLDSSSVLYGQEFIKENYNIARQALKYHDFLQKAQKHTSSYLPHSHELQLCPWCHLNSNMIWHSIKMRSYRLNQNELDAIAAIQKRADLSNYGNVLPGLRKRGIII